MSASIDPTSSSRPTSTERGTQGFGAYFAVLPALPSIPPTLLLKACDEASNNHGIPVTWLHHRVGQLVHPQLSSPLDFIEISGRFDNEHDCDRILQALTAQTSVVGNAELLLVLPGTPIPILPCTIPEATNSTETSRAKELFDQYGLVALRQCASDVDELTDHALTTFEAYYAALQGKSQRHFKEIMQRDENRFDFRLDLMGEDLSDNPAASNVWETVEAESSWMGLVRSILGESCVRVKCGCVLSLPGAGEQYWHSDGVHVGSVATWDSDECAPTHALCVFVPLLDLTDETGYTEFWAASHRYDQLLTKKGEQSLPGGTLGVISKGDCLLYDYRTIHRGMPNRSHAARPVCYYLYAKAGFELVEEQNFTEESVWE